MFMFFYGEHEAEVSLAGELLSGSIPAKQFKDLSSWLFLNKEKTNVAWNKAIQGNHFEKIKPMR